jgi:hypothetical protein
LYIIPAAAPQQTTRKISYIMLMLLARVSSLGVRMLTPARRTGP